MEERELIDEINDTLSDYYTCKNNATQCLSHIAFLLEKEGIKDD